VLWHLAAVIAAKTPPPSTVPDDQVTPGVWGFVITAAVGIAAVLLIIDMSRRIRRVNYRERVLADIAAEKAGSEDAGAAEAENAESENAGSAEKGDDARPRP